MITNCPVCGKGFDILWPHLWAYKIGNQYFCTWKCLQRKRKEEEDMPKGKVRDRMKVALEVVDRIRNTEDPIIYLKEIGYGNPGQAYSDIREMLRKTRPDLFAQLPENLRTWRTLCVQEPRKTVKQVETPEGEFTPARVKVDGPLRIETPEAKNVKVVEVPERPAKKPIEYKVTGIQTEVGEFWVVREGKIKWVPGRLAKEDPVLQVMWPEAEPALVPEMWRRFAEIILYVLDLLEVES